MLNKGVLKARISGKMKKKFVARLMKNSKQKEYAGCLLFSR